jgi:hypothetical protein
MAIQHQENTVNSHGFKFFELHAPSMGASLTVFVLVIAVLFACCCCGGCALWRMTRRLRSLRDLLRHRHSSSSRSAHADAPSPAPIYAPAPVYAPAPAPIPAANPPADMMQMMQMFAAMSNAGRLSFEPHGRPAQGSNSDVRTIVYQPAPALTYAAPQRYGVRYDQPSPAQNSRPLYPQTASRRVECVSIAADDQASAAAALGAPVSAVAPTAFGPAAGTPVPIWNPPEEPLGLRPGSV